MNAIVILLFIVMLQEYFWSMDHIYPDASSLFPQFPQLCIWNSVWSIESAVFVVDWYQSVYPAWLAVS